MNATWQDNAKQAMTARGQLQQELADALGVSPSRLSHWLAGRHEPSLDMLRRIAAELDMTFSQLTEGDDRYISDPKEIALVASFRAVQEGQKDQALELIKAILNTMQEKPD